MRASRLLAAAALAVAAGLLTGCVAIPDSGGVNTGKDIDTDTQLQLTYQVFGPQKGDTQETVVQNFIQAALAPEDRYHTAREFLASSVRETWNPDAGVTIRQGEGTSRPADGDPTTQLYSMRVSATINADGIYAPYSTPVDEDPPFKFVKEHGEWRISDPPPGIIISEEGFARVFAAHPLFFFDPTYEYLVPDMRWFPTTSLISTKIANALLAGPAPWLGNGVLATAIPAGTKLLVPVNVDSSTANVALSDEARSKTSDQDRSRMQQQLTASLTSVNVTSVAVTVGGIPIAASGPGDRAGVVPTVSSNPLVRRGDQFGYVSGSEITPVKGLSSQVISVDPLAATYAVRTATVAVRSVNGVFRLGGTGGDPVTVNSHQGQVDPSIDNSGYVWTAQASRVSSLRVMGLDNASHPVAVSSLGDDNARIVSMDVSRDGARLLLLLANDTDSGTTARLVVAGIVRDQTKRPTALGTEPVELPLAVGAPIDATWLSDRTVAAISGVGTATGVTEYDVGGPSTFLGTVENATQIVGGNGGESGLRVLDTGGKAFRWSSGTSWRSAGFTADFLATQQPG